MQRITFLVALAVGFSSAAAAQDFTAPRSATVPTAGVQRIEVFARAGTLRIDGRPGIREVRVTGMARASSRRLLDDIKLIAESKNGTLYVEADIPERDSDWRDDYMGLDLVIEVPSELPLQVEDGSGELEIRNVGALDLKDGSGEATIEHVGGRLRMRDGSGEIRILDVKGDVEVTDGSGTLDIRQVEGNVEVGSKGSGELRVEQVSKSVRVGSKGSGTVDVTHVGGDFTVEHKSSGSIEYSDVKGRVDVPERDRRGRRRPSDWR
jgi:hypothetical protein